MSQEIVYDLPPLWDEISAAFTIRPEDGVIFSFGSRLYNPFRVTIPPHILAHEAVHGERQRGDVDGWWMRYIESRPFRAQEELVAHQAEYRWLEEHGNRRQRRAALKQTAERLAAPLYGPICTEQEARVALAHSPVLATW